MTIVTRNECNRYGVRRSISGFKFDSDIGHGRARIVKEKLLTSEERYVVGTILEKVKSAMVWDATLSAYTDNEGIILDLDKNEMAALTRAMKKI